VCYALNGSNPLSAFQNIFLFSPVDFGSPGESFPCFYSTGYLLIGVHQVKANGELKFPEENSGYADFTVCVDEDKTTTG
jgi:hypothetical protein